MGRNEDLVAQIQQGKNWLLEELWEDNTGLINYISLRYMNGCGCHYDENDLKQAGYLGLHVAAMTYSPDRGASFATHAFDHIRKAMREVAGLRGKRDVLLDAVSLNAPIGKDGDNALIQFQPSMQEPDMAELENLQTIVREAVAHIREDSIRDTIEAVYWKGESITDFAANHSICKQAASERLQKGYAILRRNKKIVSLALAQGYDIDYHKHKTLGAFRTDGVSSVESAVIYQEKMKRRREGLYKHLGNLLGRGIDSLENGSKKT